MAAITTTHSHSMTTRITHWVMAASFALLFGTGAAMFDHRPAFRLGRYALRLPRIPSWLTITASAKTVHYVFAAAFVLCGACYLVWGIRNGHFKSLAMTREDTANLVPMQLYYLGLRKGPPAYGRYNPLQKLAYSIVLFAIAPLIVLSGTAMLPFAFLHPIGAIFPGGAKIWHFALMAALCLFAAGHLTMVLATGFAKNIRRMI